MILNMRRLLRVPISLREIVDNWNKLWIRAERGGGLEHTDITLKDIKAAGDALASVAVQLAESLNNA